MSMRLHFQRWPWDIAVCLGFVVLTLILSLTFGSAWIFGLPALLWIPGYLATAAIYPKTGEITWVLRGGLSFALTLVVQPPLLLVLSFADISVNLITVDISMLVLA